MLNVFSHSEPTAVADPYYQIFPLLDWHEINGVTAEHDTPIPKCGDATQGTWPITYTAFVGGVADGRFGAAALDFASHNTSARKSFFFLDGAVAALASNVSNGRGEPGVPVAADVWTTLASRLVAADAPGGGGLTLGFANGSSAAFVDGNYSFGGARARDVRWLHAGGVGYFPWPNASGAAAAPAVAALGVRLGEVAGDYRSIGAYSGTVRGRLLTAYLDHGDDLPPAGAAQAGFAYVVAPNVSAAQMPALDAPSGPAGAACLAAEPAVHGASAADGSVARAVFWQESGGEYDTSACGGGLLSLGLAGSAGLVVASRDGATLNVTVAHPTRTGGAPLYVTVRGAVARGAGCSPDAARGLTVVSVALPQAPGMTGASVGVSCSVVAAYQ